MPDFKDRLRAERAELDTLLERLEEFIATKIDQISEPQAAILRIQALAMDTYRQCLIERLQLLEQEPEPEEPTDD